MTLDFTSALYLGFRHAHGTLRPWAQLTTGRPAALEPAPEAECIATALAQLMRHTFYADTTGGLVSVGPSLH